MATSISETIAHSMEEIAKRIDEAQAQIETLLAERQKLESLPLHPDEAEQFVKGAIADQRHRAADDVGKMVEALAAGRDLNVYTNELIARAFSDPEVKTDAVNLFPVLAYLLGDQLEKPLVKLARDHAKKKGALTAEDRATRLADIDAQLEAFEVQEEAAISEAELNDIWRFRRRADARPEIILGVAA